MTACWPGWPTIANSSAICSLRPEKRLRRSIGAEGRKASPTSRRRSWTSASARIAAAIPADHVTAGSRAQRRMRLAADLLLLPLLLLVLGLRLPLDRLLRWVFRRRIVAHGAGLRARIHVVVPAGRQVALLAR